MQFSNKYILNKKSKEQEKLVGEIGFDELQEKVTEIVGNPIFCHSCGAAVIKADTIKDNSPLGLHFTCEFCGTVNKIDENQFNKLKTLKDNIVEFLGMKKERDIKDKIVAAIDISGSMDGKPIEAVKQSLIETLRDLSVNSPDTGFALITFTSGVYLYKSNGEAVIKISSDNIYSEEKIIRKFQEIEYNFEKVGDNYKGWINLISTLHAIANTALGPAALGGASLLKENGRLILLTDGLANMGVGSRNNVTSKSKKNDFYRELGEKCRDKGIVIEIVGVASSAYASVELELIGQMARITGGDIYMVDLSEIKSTFNALSRSDIIGKNVKIRLYKPEHIEIEDVSGDVNIEKHEKSLNANVGNVNPDRKFCMTFDTIKDLKENNEIPIQVEVEYTDLEGRERRRIYRDKITVTDNENDIIENLRSEISDIFYKQKSAELGRTGQEEDGINVLRDYTKRLKFYSKQAAPDAGERITRSATLIEKELDNMIKIREEKNKDVKYSRYQAKVSYGTGYEERAVSRMERQTKIMREDHIIHP
jgi:hypothetical protein